MTHPMKTTDDAYPSNFIKAADLKGRNVNLVIKAITQETIGQAGEMKPMITFSKVKKGFLLNVTNARTIEAVYGKTFADWLGKTITLYPTTVSFQGSIVDCVRVRVPEPVQAPEPGAPLDNVLGDAANGDRDPDPDDPLDL